MENHDFGALELLEDNSYLTVVPLAWCQSLEKMKKSQKCLFPTHFISWQDCWGGLDCASLTSQTQFKQLTIFAKMVNYKMGS